MRVLYFDTETNGLPKNRGGSDTDINNHPALLEIAWQILENGVVLKRRSAIVKPDPAMVWNVESAGIHKLDKDYVYNHGVAAVDILREFRDDCADCQTLISHNLAFDLPVVKCAYRRIWSDEQFEWLPPQQICTMKATIAVCKLPFPNSKYPPRAGDYKQPRMLELHKFLFGDEGTFAVHTAAGDVECLVKCAQELVRRNLLVI